MKFLVYYKVVLKKVMHASRNKFPLELHNSRATKRALNIDIIITNLIKRIIHYCVTHYSADTGINGQGVTEMRRQIANCTELLVFAFAISAQVCVMGSGVIE